MAAAPRRRKLHIDLALRLAFAAALTGIFLSALTPMMAAPPEYVVVDRNTGLAISGFDPVAYFVDAEAKPGNGAFELNQGGATWRFRNEGNRAAFKANPEIYMPRFGGYDPVAVARGVGVGGNPLYWLISGERLYLFSTEETRTAFADDAAGLITTADRSWPSVQLTLSPLD